MVMNIATERFGALEIGEDQILDFPEGIIGFPNERKFVLLPHNSSGFLAWLQSAESPAIALPVVSAHVFGNKYPDVAIEPSAAALGLGTNPDELAIVVVLSAPQAQPATVNLLAPIIVNVATHKGAQLILEGSRFSTRELFVREQDAEAPRAQAAAE